MLMSLRDVLFAKLKKKNNWNISIVISIARFSAPSKRIQTK